MVEQGRLSGLLMLVNVFAKSLIAATALPIPPPSAYLFPLLHELRVRLRVRPVTGSLVDPRPLHADVADGRPSRRGHFRIGRILGFAV